MSITLFTIIFSLMIGGMLVFLALNIKSLPVVKAGKVNKPCKAMRYVFGAMPSDIRINGVRKDVSGDRQMLVSGNSMKNYNIFDGQRIYVRPMAPSEKTDIRRYPVLVFHIINGEEGDAKYKLRKFVGYVVTDNLKELYEAHKDRIKVTEDTFLAQCERKLTKLRDDTDGELVLSETYDEAKHSILYSLHPVDSIFGKVEYAM